MVRVSYVLRAHASRSEADGLDDALAVAPRDPVADVEVRVGDEEEATDERADDLLTGDADREGRCGEDERRARQHLPVPRSRDAERQRDEEDD
jgi:hypothetical protein